jgi:hypothetical protein
MGLLLHKRFQIEFNNPILALDAVAWKWEVPSYSASDIGSLSRWRERVRVRVGETGINL